MKSKIIFLVSLFISLSLNAKEIPLNYFYYLNKPMYNPAFAGIENKTNISLLGNIQYINIGYNFKKLNFNYGYYLSLSRILPVSSGYHNIGILYQL